MGWRRYIRDLVVLLLFLSSVGCGRARAIRTVGDVGRQMAGLTGGAHGRLGGLSAEMMEQANNALEERNWQLATDLAQEAMVWAKVAQVQMALDAADKALKTTRQETEQLASEIKVRTGQKNRLDRALAQILLRKQVAQQAAQSLVSAGVEEGWGMSNAAAGTRKTVGAALERAGRLAVARLELMNGIVQLWQDRVGKGPLLVFEELVQAAHDELDHGDFTAVQNCLFQGEQWFGEWRQRLDAVTSGEGDEPPVGRAKAALEQYGVTVVPTPFGVGVGFGADGLLASDEAGLSFVRRLLLTDKRLGALVVVTSGSRQRVVAAKQDNKRLAMDVRQTLMAAGVPENRVSTLAFANEVPIGALAGKGLHGLLLLVALP